jgi:NADPH:quinone reductase-like Zn-dependent oxidoreductase
MRAIQLTAVGLDQNRLIDIITPEPGAYEVLLSMRAASLNFRDLAVAIGKYQGVNYPLVPLSDGVGMVEAVGAGVTRFKPGDRVCPIFTPRWLSGNSPENPKLPSLGGEIDGVLRQKMVIHEQDGVLVPAHLSDVEAATLPCAGVTAWSAVVAYGQVKPGDTVLIEGTGGVALFALQFAKLAGARVALVSSSDEKLERARALGADITLNYTQTPEWGGPIAKLTGGVDLVVETVGAATLTQAVTAIKKGGRIAQVGLLSSVGASLPLQFFIPRGVNLQGILVGSRDQFENMARAIALHKIKPVLAETFAFDQFGAALSMMAPGASHFGKITLAI